MQMKVPYPNNTEDSTITFFNTFIHRMILGEQVCALCAKFSNTPNRRLQ